MRISCSATRGAWWLASLLAAACAPSASVPAPQRPAPAPVAAPPAPPHVAESPFELAEKALAASRYADAERGFRAELQGAAAARARLGLARTLLETGRYAEAEALLELSAFAPEEQPEALVLAAESLRARGKSREAEALLAPLSAEPSARRVRVLLGELLLERGERARAGELLLTLIEDYNEGRVDESDGAAMALVGRAAELLESPQDANEAYNAAERAGVNAAEVLLWRAELFLSHHDPGHAEEVLNAVLERAPNHAASLTWMAHVKLEQSLDFDAARELVLRALAINPNLAHAYFVLAGLALRDLDFETANEKLERGLSIDPDNLELWSLRGAARFLADDNAQFEQIRARVFKQNPLYTRFYGIVAEYAEWEHRYERIVAMMRDAVAIDPDDAEAQAALGLNLIRAGDEVTGVRALQRSFAKDPFNVRVFNTLNLFETTIPKSYLSERRGRFVIRYPKEEAALLDRYVPALLEEAWRKFVGFYGFTPSEPIGIELYSEREHFAVRTSGLPETAIQGVCFGKTLASLTPRRESFNLGMTLWHELAHVFHIQLSDSHVPRWLTEGMAEYETIVARPEWRREQDQDLFRARRAGRLPHIAAMNQAFSGAKDIQDMATAYYASSQIVVMLAERFGRPPLNQLLALHARGLRGPEALKRAFGVEAAELDREFEGYLGKSLARYSGQFMPFAAQLELSQALAAAQAEPKALQRQLGLALSALESGQLPLAERALEQARSIDPKSPDVAFLSARAQASAGRLDGARALLVGLAKGGHDGYAVQMALGEVARAAKDSAALRAALEAARLHDPSEAEPLKGLWALAQQAKDVGWESQILEQLAALEQHDGSVYRRLLTLLCEQKQYARAVQYGQAALYADIESAETHAAYARALAGVGQVEPARFEFTSATLCPDQPKALAQAHRDFAEFLSQRGQPQEAKRELERARALDPDKPPAPAAP